MNNQTLIFILLALIISSAIFSATETAFSSLNPIKLKHLIEKGNKRAKKTLYLSEHFEKVLVTILVGNNIVNILAASLATILFVSIFNEDLGITISTVVMTTLVLIFGEITPKSLAKEMPEQFAMFITPFMQLMYLLLFPLVQIFTFIQKVMRSLFKLKQSKMTEEEVITYIDEASKEGSINSNERDLIQKVFLFDQLKVLDILTPRVSIEAIDLNDTIEEIKKTFEESGHSRLPVYEKDLDTIKGILHYKDFMSLVWTQKKTIKQVMSDPIDVTEYMRVVDLLHVLKSKKEHLAIVKDEYGGTEGIVTLEDIVEELVGDIFDEHDEVMDPIKSLDENTYLVKSDTEIDHLCETLDIKYEGDAQTVNGFILDIFGKIPNVFEKINYETYEIIILKATKKMITEVKFIKKESISN
jgi:CBS domain containing-hemolysin-like protein